MSDNEKNTTSQNSAFRRLYRSNTQKVLAGVCGGVAEYFNIDVIIVRVLWLVAAVLGGTGILAYIICWLIIPPQDSQTTHVGSTGAVGIIVGIILIFIGIGMLFSWTGWCHWSMFAWPGGWSAFPFFFLVLLGGLLIGIAITKNRQPMFPPKTTASSAAEETSTTEEQAPPPRPSTVHRSRDHRVIAGICGGLGEYFNLDPTIVRLLWVLVGLGSAGGAVLVYIILMFIIPEEPY